MEDKMEDKDKYIEEILKELPGTWQPGRPEETAVLILPGKFQSFRITEGAKLWPDKGQYLFVAGTRGDPFYSENDIVDLTGKSSLNLFCQGWAEHTPDQMEWIVKLLQKRFSFIKHLIVATAAYHLPRCVLTLVRAMENARYFFQICPWPIWNPLENYPELLEEELNRIFLYQEKGDVAKWENWQQYKEWREFGKTRP
ncbi:MAG: hypothetical protein PHE77_01450 [Candidatus Pacebacteria bacterium]|nr:hypothetical protein [Candidatus Paceibacterota bacterium]